MPKLKHLPAQIKKDVFISLKNTPTISILQPLDYIERRPNDHFIAHIFSKGGFSNDYLAYNTVGDLIIKSDFYQTFEQNGDIFSRGVRKDRYPHHHIKGTQNMETRIESILIIEGKNNRK